MDVRGVVTRVVDNGRITRPSQYYEEKHEYTLYVSFELKGRVYEDVFLKTVELEPQNIENLLGLDYVVRVDPAKPRNLVTDSSQALIRGVIVEIIALIGSASGIHWIAGCFKVDMRLPAGETLTPDWVTQKIGSIPDQRKRVIRIVTLIMLALGLLMAALVSVSEGLIMGGVMVALYVVNFGVGMLFANSRVQVDSTQYVDKIVTAVLRRENHKIFYWELTAREQMYVDMKSPTGYADAKLIPEATYQLALNRQGKVLWAGLRKGDGR